MNQGKTQNFNSIVEILQSHAEHNPNKLCVGDKKKSLTYGQFWDSVQKGAAYLSEFGIKKGDVVVVRTVQKVEMLLAAMSIQLLGGTFSPLEKSIKEDRILEIMSLLHSNYYLAEKAVQGTDIQNISLGELYTESQRQDRDITTSSALVFPEPEDIADILFTTGTTGESKGIIISHKANVAVAENIISGVKNVADEINLISAPINHSYGIRRCYAEILNGSSIILADSFVFIKEFFNLLDEYKVTAITFVPAVFEMVIKFSQDALSKYEAQLNYIQMGTAPLSERHKDILRTQLPSVRLYNFYGATESGCTICLDFNKYADRKGCVGEPSINTTVLFVDENRNFFEATQDRPGILVFQGAMNMNGYIGDPSVTKEVLIDGKVYTNDLGYRGEDGFIYLLGRQGDIINMGGLKIAPGEIEDIVNKFEFIKECACIPIEDEIAGEAPKLYVVMKVGETFDLALIKRLIGEKLEAIKVPKEIEAIDDLPKTYNGKIKKNALKEIHKSKCSRI
jgi:acyl-coenzyme A synthetase/AMP-(fatty) acid ligase